MKYISYYAAAADRQLIFFFPLRLFTSRPAVESSYFILLPAEKEEECELLFTLELEQPEANAHLQSTSGGRFLFALLSDLPIDITVHCGH